MNFLLFKCFEHFRTVYIKLNESSYTFHPNIFGVGMVPDLTLWTGGTIDGLQEWATYNPPGPTKPGAKNPVTQTII